MASHIYLREEYVWLTTLLNLTKLGFKGFFAIKKQCKANSYYETNVNL